MLLKIQLVHFKKSLKKFLDRIKWHCRILPEAASAPSKKLCYIYIIIYQKMDEDEEIWFPSASAVTVRFLPVLVARTNKKERISVIAIFVKIPSKLP